jgi:MFS family permease
MKHVFARLAATLQPAQPDAAAPAGRLSWLSAHRSSLALWLVVVLASAPLGVFEFVLPLYGAALGASATEVGGLFSIFSITALATRPVIGWLLDADRRPPTDGRRNARLSILQPQGLLALGLLAYALALGLFAVAQSVALLAAARLVQGVASATTWLTVTVLLANASERGRRGATFGLLTALGAWGSGLGAGWTTLALLLFDETTRSQARGILAEAASFSGLPLAGLLFPTPTLPPVQVYHIIFWGYVAFVLVALAALTGAWGLGVRKRARLSEGGSRIQPRTAIEHVPLALQSPIANLQTLLQRTWPLLASAFLRSGAYGLTLPVLTLYLDRRFGLGVVGLGLVYALPGLVYALAPGVLGRMADRVGHLPAAVGGLLVSAAVSAAVPLVPFLPLLAVLWTLEAAAFSLAGPALSALLTDRTDEGARGRAFALYAVVGGLGAAATPTIGGWLYDQLGAGPPFWASAALVFLSTIVLSAALRSVRSAR